MGLTTWKNATGGLLRRAEVGVARNYLAAEEITELNRVVTMYLDFAEDQAVEEVKRLEAGDTPKEAPGAGRQAAKKASRRGDGE